VDLIKKATDALLSGKQEEITPDDTKLYAFLKDRVEDTRRSTSRVTHESIWLTNIAYLLGYENIYFDPVLRRYRSNDATQPYLTRSRIHANKILPTIQNRLFKTDKSTRPKIIKSVQNSNESIR